MGQKYVIGIDFGTLSARAVVLDAENGTIVGDKETPYAHGVISGCLPDKTPLPPSSALADAKDYEDALCTVMAGALQNARVTPDTVRGICVDATSCTLVPVDAAGRVLSLNPAFSARPEAWIKLWKHHTARQQAEAFRRLAEQRGENFLSRCGYYPSCEWTFPKMMEMYENDREVFEQTDLFLDLCDYLTLRLSGVLTRSIGSAEFKSCWSSQEGYPSEEFLNELLPGFGRAALHKLRGPVLALGACAGGLTADMAARTGLLAGTPVAVGTVDGHTSLAAMGLCKAGDASLVIGTSNVLAILTDQNPAIPGICGIGRGGLGGELYGIDSGQSCTGEMLQWMAAQTTPSAYEEEAKKQGISIHTLLSRKAAAGKPWENTLTVLDWFNGNRNILCDMDLKGAVLGLNTETKPEDIYLAMLQSIASGTRRILERCEEYGVKVQRIVACGGIPVKSPFFMHQYASILGRPICVCPVSEGPSAGAAIYAAVAANIYPSVIEAQKHMAFKNASICAPDKEHAQAYQAIYQRYCMFHDLLSGNLK